MIRTAVISPLRVLALTTLLAFGSSPMDAGAQSTCDSKPSALEINNTTLHYFECGEGEPLVFVHGGLGGLHTFQTPAQAFAPHFRVIAYSRRFFPPNAQPRPTDVDPLSIHVADLRALIKQLNAGPAHLVGHSGGAHVALALALDHPELVRSLVLGEAPVLSLLSRTSVGEALRQSWISRVMEPSRKHSRPEISRTAPGPSCTASVGIPASTDCQNLDERSCWTHKRHNCDRFSRRTPPRACLLSVVTCSGN